MLCAAHAPSSQPWGPSSPYRSRGQGGQEHRDFTDWEGEAQEGKATATAGQCRAGWWRGFHGALWSDPQLAEHAAWRWCRWRGGGRPGNKSAASSSWSHMVTWDADQRVRWNVSLDLITSQTQPCRSQPPPPTSPISPPAQAPSLLGSELPPVLWRDGPCKPSARPISPPENPLP